MYIFVLLLCHGDIEPNPDPKKREENCLFVCHWNVNSLSAHNFWKLTQLKAYISMYKHDFTCLSEPYLDFLTTDGLLEIDGYNLVSADNPNKIKRGEFCIYYMQSLPVQVIGLPYFKEALLLGMTYNNKNAILFIIYRYPSQNNSEFDLFLFNFEKRLSAISNGKPSLSVIRGDFNTRSFSWCLTISILQRRRNSPASSNGFSQLIN